MPGHRWSSDLRTLPIGLPAHPRQLWNFRALELGWTPHRLAIGIGGFLPWSLHFLILPDSSGNWGLLTGLIVGLVGGSLLGSIALLALARGMTLELACARKPPLRTIASFAWDGRRSAACTGLFFALISFLLYFILGSLGVGHPIALLAGAWLWWILTGLGMAAMAADGSDAIDAIQRATIYIAHRPLTALSTLWPALLLVAGMTSIPFLFPSAESESGMGIFASLLRFLVMVAMGGVSVSLLMGVCVGSHLALRHANDGQEPAELWQSGSEGGVLKPGQVDHG
jgi:hypothetical protein